MTNHRVPANQPPRPLRHTLRRIGLALLAGTLLGSTAAAQGAAGLTGNYILNTESGPITLTLTVSGTSVSGALWLGGNTYELTGQVDDLGIYGQVYTGQEALYFEAEAQGQDLYMLMAQVDPNTGAPDPATAGEYLFQRVAAEAPLDKQPGGQANTTPAAAGQTARGQTAGPPPGMAPAQVGRRYEAGAVVGSTDAGVAFSVPAGYYAGYHPQENAFMVMSDTQPGLVIVEALSHLDLRSAVAQLGQAFESEGATVLPQGQPTVTGNVARASFTVLSANGSLPLYVMGVAGPADNVLIVAGLGGPQEQQVVQALVENLAGGATVFQPTRASADAAAAQLSGAHLWRRSSNSSADSNSGYLDSSSVDLHLCQNGAYAYASSSRFSVNVYGADGGGVMGGSDSSQEEYGRWSTESGLLGPVVVLRSDQGGPDTFVALLQADGVLYVDGLPVQVGRSSRCT